MDSTYPVNHSHSGWARAGTAIAVMMLIVLTLALIRLGPHETWNRIFPMIGLYVWMLYPVIVFVCGFHRMRTLAIVEKGLSLGGKMIEAERIEAIYIAGYFAPVVGVKLRGKRLVPPAYVFRLRDRQEEGLKELEQWAAKQGIRYELRTFLRLV